MATMLKNEEERLGPVLDEPTRNGTVQGVHEGIRAQVVERISKFRQEEPGDHSRNAH